MRMIRGEIELAIERALEELGAGGVSFTVERPRAMEHGDYATNAALSAAKILKKNPNEVAEVLRNMLRNMLRSDEIEKIEVAGAGFINFSLSREAILHEVEKAAKEKEWGRSSIYGTKTILVEYTSPNLFKPLHIGNLVGNILGESLARLFEFSGARVKRINYPSDIGLTVAKGVWGLWKNTLNPNDIEQLGKAYVAGNAAYEDGSAKEEIDKINKVLYEDSHPQWSKLRKQGVETSRKYLDELCERLGTKFDKEFFESEAGPLGRELVQENIGRVFEESEGAVIYRGAHTRVFINSAGLPTYEAKEVGLFKLKSEAFPNFDASYTVTGSEQKDFFAVVFDAIRKVFPTETNGKTIEHIANGFLRLTTGKMSSRLGNVITGESLIADLTKAARGREDVAVGAVKYAVLKQGSNKDIVFEPEKSLSLEGDSGPYLQYAHTRALSLLRKAEGGGAELSGDPASGQQRNASAPESSAPSARSILERTLIHFPDVVERAAKELEPHHVTTYLTELAGAFNSWYAHERVIGGKNPEYGLLLTQAVEQTLAKGLHVLGIPAPEEM